MRPAERVIEVDASRLRTIAGSGRSASLARERTLPVVAGLRGLLPEGGLRRGTTIALGAEPEAGGVTSLMLGLLGAASHAGSWCAAIGCADLGMVAAAEYGVDVQRFAAIPSVPPSLWPSVTGALVDAVDIVVARPPPHLRLGDARRLVSRTRERESVLVVLSGLGGRRWPERADVRLSVVSSRWHGPRQGEGHLECRRVTVSVEGRGAARPRHADLWLPGPGGDITAAAPAVAAPAVAAPAGAPVATG